jgi:hypothetical protein
VKLNCKGFFRRNGQNLICIEFIHTLHDAVKQRFSRRLPARASIFKPRCPISKRTGSYYRRQNKNNNPENTPDSSAIKKRVQDGNGRKHFYLKICNFNSPQLCFWRQRGVKLYHMEGNCPPAWKFPHHSNIYGRFLGFSGGLEQQIIVPWWFT